jgi:undecaprenyl-diphosphatase
MPVVSKRVASVWRANAALLSSVTVIGGLLLTFGLIATAIDGEPSAFDREVILAFRNPANPSDPIGPPWLQEAARDVTALGSTAVLGIVLVAVVGYLFLAGKRAAAWLVLVAVVGGVTLNTGLKIGFGRPRPELVAPAAQVFTYSFPSGHAALSAVAYLTLGALLAQTHASSRFRVFFMSSGVLLTFLVGLSRIYLGVHYPTDVLAGWCVGLAWAWGCWALMARLQRAGQVEPPERP